MYFKTPLSKTPLQFSLLLLVGVMVILSGCGLGPVSEESSSDSGDLSVIINYQGEWRGAIGTDGSTRSVDGSGREKFEIEGSPTVVSVTATKVDDSGGQLSASICMDDRVLTESKTTAEYGGVSMSETIIQNQNSGTQHCGFSGNPYAPSTPPEKPNDDDSEIGVPVDESDSFNSTNSSSGDVETSPSKTNSKSGESDDLEDVRSDVGCELITKVEDSDFYDSEFNPESTYDCDLQASTAQIPRFSSASCGEIEPNLYAKYVGSGSNPPFGDEVIIEVFTDEDLNSSDTKCRIETFDSKAHLIIGIPINQYNLLKSKLSSWNVGGEIEIYAYDSDRILHEDDIVLESN
jgi:hypothetical protein